MAATAALGRRTGVEVAGLLGLAASPLVIGTGLFVVIYPLADPFVFALPATTLVNALTLVNCLYVTCNRAKR